MKQKIYQVSEAFSMQPRLYKVGDTVNGMRIARIVEESIYDTGDPYDFYIGYDDVGNRVFAVRKMAANVQYDSKQHVGK